MFFTYIFAYRKTKQNYVYSYQFDVRRYVHRLFVAQTAVLFLLGVEVGGNRQIIEGLATLGLEAFSITIAAVIGSCMAAWALWYLLYKKKGGKA